MKVTVIEKKHYQLKKKKLLFFESYLFDFSIFKNTVSTAKKITVI